MVKLFGDEENFELALSVLSDLFGPVLCQVARADDQCGLDVYLVEYIALKLEKTLT